MLLFEYPYTIIFVTNFRQEIDDLLALQRNSYCILIQFKERQVQILCSENRIPDISRPGYMRLMQKDAKKLIDGRELRHE
ncbi:hypothetical protein D3Z62_21450 [Lachnospiraceae bacterium]|nr:hypothetical protein [Lachnospiraceae bacterium]